MIPKFFKEVAVMNMTMMRTLVASFVVVLIGCGYNPIVESRCDTTHQYLVIKSNEGFRLHLTVGRLVNPNGCTNTLGARARAIKIDTSVKSIEEAHNLIESEVRRYQQVSTSRLPQPQANHP